MERLDTGELFTFTNQSRIIARAEIVVHGFSKFSQTFGANELIVTMID